MINPNNYKDLASKLSDRLGYIIPEQKLEQLTEKQRNFITTLLYLDETLQATRDGKHPLAVIVDILKVKQDNTTARDSQTNYYVKQKINQQ